MNKNIIKFLSFFILSSKKRKSFRQRFTTPEGNLNLAEEFGYKNCYIHPSTVLVGKENLSMNENCWIGGNALIAAGKAKIKFGHNVIIAERCVLLTNNHNYKAKTCLPYDRGNISRPIEIEDCVWIGMGATILGGVKIEKGAIIGAGAVVTKSIPKCAIVGGNPAKIIGWRDEKTFDKLYSSKKFEELKEINPLNDYEIVENKFNDYLESKKPQTRTAVERVILLTRQNKFKLKSAA